LKELLRSLEVRAFSVHVPNSNGEIANTVHHTGLEQILEELIVRNTSTGFDLNDEPLGLMMRVCFKRRNHTQGE
jgi:hypothetical protein